MKNFIYFLVFFALILITRIFLIDIVSISSYSMSPTLWPSEWVVVNKVININRGDVITFYDKNSAQIYIKRVIAVTGDKIKYDDDTIELNDQKLSKHKTQIDRELPAKLEKRNFKAFIENLDSSKYKILIDENKTTRNTPEIQIKEQQYFVIGDNRNHSLDSRDFGPIHKKRVIGKAQYIIYSQGKFFRSL